MQDISHDHQLRALLMAHLAPRLAPADRVLDELGLAHGRVRVDVAVCCAQLEGFEIKAAKDTLTRLPAQADAYGQVFGLAWVVTTPNHLAKAKALLPRWWGILVAKPGKQGLHTHRKARPNPVRNAMALCQLLWREEAVAKLEALCLLKGFKSKPRDVLFARLIERLSLGDIEVYVRHCLATRQGWRDPKAES
jgi:hypothetical protein